MLTQRAAHAGQQYLVIDPFQQVIAGAALQAFDGGRIRVWNDVLAISR